jgi:hypothetical protein
MGPLCYRGTIDLSAYHKEISVPLTRLHDVVWLNYDAVDISTVFPDFRDDPLDPDNYDFAATDDYMEAIIKVGSGIVYRLGESIEHTPRKYRVNPPSDPGKWAEICKGIIRHYNEAWADGFSYGIEYWEIWNEPEVRPAMWTGTDKQYFELYEIASKAIKAEFPDVKVGGPALGNVGGMAGDRFQVSKFALDFLAHCRETGAPLDFFSWHRYTADPADLPPLAEGVRRMLDEFGFPDAESHLNEWNFLPDNDWGPMLRKDNGTERAEWYSKMHGPYGAAFVAYALSSLQNAPLDKANYYTGEIQGFGLFDIFGRPKKTYYTFKAFNLMLDNPVKVMAHPAAKDRLSVLSGIHPEGGRAQERFLRAEFLNVPWRKMADYEIIVIDDENDWQTSGEGVVVPYWNNIVIPLPSPGVVLVQFHW